LQRRIFSTTKEGDEMTLKEQFDIVWESMPRIYYPEAVKNLERIRWLESELVFKLSAERKRIAKMVIDIQTFHKGHVEKWNVLNEVLTAIHSGTDKEVETEKEVVVEETEEVKKLRKAFFAGVEWSGVEHKFWKYGGDTTERAFQSFLRNMKHENI
jgi:hypothetical protein